MEHEYKSQKNKDLRNEDFLFNKPISLW